MLSVCLSRCPLVPSLGIVSVSAVRDTVKPFYLYWEMREQRPLLIMCSILVSLFLRQVSLCTSSWHPVHSNPPASASQVLGLQMWATTPSLYYYFLGDALSLPWCKHSSPYHNFLSSHYTGSRWVLESTILPPKPPSHWYIPPNETAHKYPGLFTKLWHLKGLGKTAQVYMTSTPHVISRWSLIVSWQ